MFLVSLISDFFVSKKPTFLRGMPWGIPRQGSVARYLFFLRRCNFFQLIYYAECPGADQSQILMNISQIQSQIVM